MNSPATLLDLTLGAVNEKAEPPWIVGVLNVTPDSFSDGGFLEDSAAAVAQGRAFAAAGAHFLDIGGESTAPGRKAVTAALEISRVEEVVRELSGSFFVSVDTYKSETAEACLTLGAKMINDVSALRADRELPAVVRAHSAFIVLMYSKEDALSPHARSHAKEYGDLLQSIRVFLSERIEFALASGIREDKIVLDPGMGAFISANPDYSWLLLERFQMIREWFPSFPIMVATSRKGFLGGAASERDPLSQLTALAACLKGGTIVRTHNPAMAAEFFRAWRKMFGAGKDQPG